MSMTNAEIGNIYDCDIKWAKQSIDTQQQHKWKKLILKL